MTIVCINVYIGGGELEAQRAQYVQSYVLFCSYYLMLDHRTGGYPPRRWIPTQTLTIF